MGAAALGARGGCGFPRWASRGTSPHAISAAMTTHILPPEGGSHRRTRLMSDATGLPALLPARGELIVDNLDEHVGRPGARIGAVLAPISECRIGRLHLRE